MDEREDAVRKRPGLLPAKKQAYACSDNDGDSTKKTEDMGNVVRSETTDADLFTTDLIRDGPETVNDLGVNIASSMSQSEGEDKVDQGGGEGG